jgi:hypothetical protein
MGSGGRWRASAGLLANAVQAAISGPYTSIQARRRVWRQGRKASCVNQRQMLLREGGAWPLAVAASNASSLKL